MPAPTTEDIAYMQAHAHENRQPNHIAANAVCIAATIVAVALRFVSRRLIRAKIGPDDWTILLGTFFTTGSTACLFITAHYGMGRHVILLKDAQSFGITTIVAEVLYNVGLFTIKISILCLYGRIFTQRWFKRSLVALGTFIALYTIPQLFGTLFQCVPLRSLWDPTITDPTCINYPAVIIAGGTINIVTDFIMLGLPIPLLWNLQISTHRKWVLTIMFLMGGIVCIISIVRLFYATHVDTVDPTWDYVWPSTISNVECCSAIIAACVPTYRPLINVIKHGAREENTVGNTKLSDESTNTMAHPLRKKWRLIGSSSASTGASSADMPLHEYGVTVVSGAGSAPQSQQDNADDRNIRVTHTFGSSVISTPG